MRNGFAWLTLGLGWVLFTTVSCGKDEATSPSGTTGTVAHCKGCSHTNECASGNICKVVTGSIGVCATAAETSCCDGPDGKSGSCYQNLGGNIDGSGGSGGGILNNGGKSGKGGSGAGGSGNTGNTSMRLGQACINDADCGAGLGCLLSDGLNGGVGPAKGMCTMPCLSSSTCLDISDNSYCYPLTETERYCIEGCEPGAAGVPKCHERTEIACSLIGLIPREGATCQDSDDCGSGELCDSNELVCGEIVTGCIPVCGGDYDCGEEQFCDFTTGLCTDTKPSGLPLGSFCDPRDVPDPCNGFCLSGTQPDEGECSALCTLTGSLTGCGWDGTGAAETSCLYATRVSGDDTAPGDVGLCGTLCDCNSQCKLSNDVCIDESDEGLIEEFWGRKGYCRPLSADETMSDSISVCPDGTSSGGTGGEGGQPSGTGGSGGTSGDAGQSGGGQGGA
jgi:hypothetical protein